MLIKFRYWQSAVETKNLDSFVKNTTSQVKAIIIGNYSYLPFLNSSKNSKLFKNIKQGKSFFKKKKKFVLVGTGGSSLGSKSIIDFTYNKKIFLWVNDFSFFVKESTKETFSRVSCTFCLIKSCKKTSH